MTVARQVAAPLACGLAFLAIAAAPPQAHSPGRGVPAPASSALATAAAPPRASDRPAPPTMSHGASPVAPPILSPTVGSTPEPETVPGLVLSGVRQAAIWTAPLGPSVAGLLLLAIGGLVLVQRVRRRR